MTFVVAIGHWTTTFSLGCKCKQLLFPLDLDSPRFLLGCSVLGMEFWVKPPTFGLPMSSQSAVLAIVPAWVAWPSRVPTITSLMTHFLATETNYAIPFQFVMMLSIAWLLGPPRIGAIWMAESSLCFPLPSFYKQI
jgi:hypothetical protein